MGFAAFWSPADPRCEGDAISRGGPAMSKLFRVFEAAMGGARRSEAMRYDAKVRRSLRTDPDGALRAFERALS